MRRRSQRRWDEPVYGWSWPASRKRRSPSDSAQATSAERKHNPYLSYLGVIAIVLLALGVVILVIKLAQGDGPMNPALVIGLVFGTLWLVVSAIVHRNE